MINFLKILENLSYQDFIQNHLTTDFYRILFIDTINQKLALMVDKTIKWFSEVDFIITPKGLELIR